MGKYLEAPKSEVYKYGNTNLLVENDLFQLIGTLVENLSETNRARTKTARELIDETLSFRLNVFEKLSLHFSREAMLAEKNRELILGIFDIVTFNNVKPVKFINTKKN